jgi:hypothetical protein
MTRLILALCAALALVIPASAATVKSAGSGNWSDPKTWDGGKRPTAGDTVLVREGHVVVYDVKSDAVIRALFIVGTVTFAPDTDTELNVGLIKIQHDEKLDENGFDCNAHPADAKPTPKSGIGQPGFTAGCLCCDGKPALLVGTPEKPIAAGKTAKIRLHFVEGMDKESCPAIVCCGGRMDFHGQPMSRTWVKLGANAKTGTSEIVLEEAVIGWRVGDRVIVTSSAHPNSKNKAEEATIKALEGTRVALEQPLTQSHSGEGAYRAEVANLSRNVVIESANPDGVRGHTMYHRGSAGGVSYAEFRHLGKEGVLGRYNLHFHLCGDTMRGSSLVGASFHHSKNRFLTVHGTNYLVVRDCVGYQSLGHGFFLEDGTEVYNVLDRNLACQALEGRPLPKQILPFDPNDGAGFWFANAHNTFTRNVAAECRQYGFRLEATPKAGLVATDGAPKRDFTFGDGKKPFDLVMSIRQPDGSRKPVDIRTLPFVRFDDNETHSNGFWGINLGLGVNGVGPDPATPHVIRNLKIWSVVGGVGIESPSVLIDGMTLNDVTYGVRGSSYKAQDWRNVSINSRGFTIATRDEFLQKPSKRHRQPGWSPEGTGDGGAKFQSPEIEVANLNPVDTLPPITVITHIRKDGNALVVRGTTSDNGALKRVTVNGTEAKVAANGEWEVWLSGTKAGAVKVTALAVDVAGNVEKTPHDVTVSIR